MAFELPRLSASFAIVTEAKFPTLPFQQWWQSVVEAIEAAIDNIRQILIDLGVAQETADGALELAQSAIKPGGIIKDEKVITDSIIPDGVTERYFVQALSGVTLPDGVETEVLAISVTKVIDESDMDIDVALRLSSNEDVRGEVKIYRDALLIDSFEPFLNGAGGTYRTILTMPFTESGIPADDYDYTVTFTRAGGASTLTADENSLIRIKEIKR